MIWPSNGLTESDLRHTLASSRLYTRSRTSRGVDFDLVDGVLEVANGELTTFPRELGARSLSAFDGVSVVFPLLAGPLAD